MRFIDLPFAAAAAASADPRTNPADVPDSLIISLPKTIPNTDTPPPYIALVLEGTAGQTMSVTVWARREAGPAADDPFAPPEALADRLFYKVAATVALTVGTMKTVPAVQGQVYLQSSGGPAAASVLRVGVMAAAIP